MNKIGIILFFQVCLIVILLSCGSKDGERKVLVKTSVGPIRGTVMETRRGEKFYAFRGIRYAEAPINENRFQPPIPVKPWNETYDATKDGYICPQPNAPNSDIVSEDCLILNVYTRNINGRAPVLVFIHGGGFSSGSSHSQYSAGPQYIMEKNVTFVTINYRLGALGFLSTGTREAPGNYGFKDQVLSLRWIQDNIQSFGGDPTCVTIWGQSAGAMSVSLHLVSPLSKGLFHRAILMSGSSTSHFYINNLLWAKQLAKRVGCPDEDTKALISCMKKLPYQRIVGISSYRDIFYDLPTLKFNYEIEKDYGQERFLLSHPSVLVASGNFTQVPIIAGITSGEFSGLAYVLYYNSTLLQLFNNNFETLAPYCFMYEKGTANSLKISKTLRRFYFNNTIVTKENLACLEDIFADSLISHGAHRLVSLAKEYTNVYYYMFSYAHRSASFYDPIGESRRVPHGGDIRYLLVSDDSGPMITENDPENKMVERMTSWLTHFAEVGDPNDKSNNWTSVINWLPSNSSYNITLDIDDACKLIEEPFSNRFAVWDQLFPVTYPKKN